MLQQTITHSVNQTISQSSHAYCQCASMWRCARPCASIRVRALQCAPMRLLVQPHCSAWMHMVVHRHELQRMGVQWRTPANGQWVAGLEWSPKPRRFLLTVNVFFEFCMTWTFHFIKCTSKIIMLCYFLFHSYHNIVHRLLFHHKL